MARHDHDHDLVGGVDVTFSWIDTRDAPSHLLLRVIRELGYFPELPTSLHMFYKEWDPLPWRDKLDILQYAWDLMYDDM